MHDSVIMDTVLPNGTLKIVLFLGQSSVRLASIRYWHDRSGVQFHGHPSIFQRFIILAFTVCPAHLAGIVIQHAPLTVHWSVIVPVHGRVNDDQRDRCKQYKQVHHNANSFAPDMHYSH